ncbi:MAG TPA: F0F1 ATP synthase subunit epsilon [Gammaproteobacteria bacterium]|jgi:F-type H+-transporting ATPase subunit epsilon|nr:F0F1 ATP synthase subunit epsilon [Gammaproteobacteria bacterium]
MTMHCDIVSAEEEIFSGRIQSLTLTGTLGELGVMPGHAPLITAIRPGPVRLRLDNGEEQVFFASGGFLEVQPSVVTVLADTAVRAEDIDEAAAAEAQDAARRALEDRAADVEFSLAAAQLAEAMARQRTVEELRRRRR